MRQRNNPMKLPCLAEIERSAALLYESMQASPQISWPLLNAHCGAEVWVKHENHNPTGAFKVRGGLMYVRQLQKQAPDVPGLVTATRGNHGQSIAFAARKYGIKAVVVVPEGNSPDKNTAMQAYGAELIVYGKDFNEAMGRCHDLATERRLYFVPSIDEWLIPGVATYAWEFFRSVPRLDRVYVPIGLGSGVIGVISAKCALGLSTEVIGVVATAANTYERSFSTGYPVNTNSADTIADGLAVRKPSVEALEVIKREVSRIITVDEEEILRAIGYYFIYTHNVAEGAGAAPLAALLKDKSAKDKRVGLVLTGGNIGAKLFTKALAAASTP